VAIVAKVAGVLCLAALAGCGSGDATAPPTTNRKATTTLVPRDLDAFDACKGFVKRQLKAPSTAKFRNYYEQDGEVVVLGTGDGPYTVMSSVDSENSFGAKLRSNFTCKVTLSGGTWKLDDISVT
jgi:hypothetical protein